MLITAIAIIMVLLLAGGYLFLDRREIEAALVAEREHSRQQAQKYDRLVDDIKALAMRPQGVVAEPRVPKARSAAELRRMFDRENEKVLADREQGR